MPPAWSSTPCACLPSMPYTVTTVGDSRSAGGSNAYNHGPLPRRQGAFLSPFSGHLGHSSTPGHIPAPGRSHAHHQGHAIGKHGMIQTLRQHQPTAPGKQKPPQRPFAGPWRLFFCLGISQHRMGRSRAVAAPLRGNGRALRAPGDYTSMDLGNVSKTIPGGVAYG